MKKVFIFMLLLLVLTGCGKKKVDAPVSVVPSLTVEQVNLYKSKISKLTAKKSWVLDQNISYAKLTLPAAVDKTYYAEILAKSKDSGYDFKKHLGKEVVEATANIKYNNGDVAGVGHFLFLQDNIVGVYYMVGNYIYSLNERDVFKKDVEWKNIENPQKKVTFKEQPFANADNLIYWGSTTNKENYIFAFEQNKLKEMVMDKDKLLVRQEINLDGIYILSMFLKDVDGDKRSEIGLLVSNTPKSDDNSKSKLLIYEFGDKLKPKYSLSFEKPMLSVDFDGENIIATSATSIEMYSFEDRELKKNYAYNKVGGYLKVDDIDGSGVQRYILRDSKGVDLYIFQRNKDGLEAIWRSYNQKTEYDGMIQTADLNKDGAKEIYIQTKTEGVKRIILDKKGFISSKDDVKPGHKYFLGDFNGDGIFEYFDTFKKGKGYTTIYRYAY